MIKGEIWWATLPSPRGSEPAKRRPVLIVQGDEFNQRNISTVICVVITSNVHLATISPNLLLEKSDSGLDKTSVINFSQIITVDKSFLTKWVFMVSKPLLAKVNESLKAVFDLL